MAYIGSKPANKPVVASDLDPAVITGQTALAVAPADTDEFLISDAGTLKRIDASLVGGITVADQWRLSANTNSGTNADVTSNWERNDNTGYGSIGTGLTESSGIFSFPSTGIYLIIFKGRMQNAASDTSSNFSLYVTTDNSNYTEVGVVASGNGSSSVIISGSSNTFLFDVTNTTTHKFKFVTASFSTDTVLTGGTDIQRTGLTMIKLGDT